MTAPQWGHLEVAERVDAAGRVGGNAMEQYQAHLRDRLDGWGITLADPEALYAVLVGQRLMIEVLAVWVYDGQLPFRVLASVTGAHNGMVAALADALPAEAKGPVS